MTNDKKQAALDAAGQARVPEKGSARERGGPNAQRKGNLTPNSKAPQAPMRGVIRASLALYAPEDAGVRR